jgi:hypothetical protein
VESGVLTCTKHFVSFVNFINHIERATRAYFPEGVPSW